MRAQPKAYVLTYGKTALTLSPVTYSALCGWKSPTSDAFDELRGSGKLHVERVVGNRKFAVSPRAEISAFRERLRKLNPSAKARAEKLERKREKAQEAYGRKLDARKAKEERRKLAANKAFLRKVPLPAGILPEDLIEPPYEKRESDEALGKALRGPWSSGADSFELWYVDRFGWVVPCLLIRDVPGYRARRRMPEGTLRRTYAVALRDGSVCRVGFGPHVLKVLSVYLRKSTARRLRPLILKIYAGSSKASECRDLLSTRRAFGSRRSYGGLFLVPGGNE